MSDQIWNLQTPTVGELLARQIFVIAERYQVPVTDDWRRDVYDSICAAFANSDKVIKYYEEMAIELAMLAPKSAVIVLPPAVRNG